MKTIYLIPAFAGALMLSTAAFAASGKYDNMCAMGLALGQKVNTDCSISAEIGGQTYCFGNQDAKTTFMKDPKANLAKADAFYNDNQ